MLACTSLMIIVIARGLVHIYAQIELMTRLAALGEVEGTAMQDVYRLLVDDSAAVRRAAANLVADLLPSHGRKMLMSQVGIADDRASLPATASQIPVLWCPNLPRMPAGWCSAALLPAADKR